LPEIGHVTSCDLNRGFSLVPSEIQNFLPKIDAEISLLIYLYQF